MTGGKERKVEIQTDLGTMVVKLYNATPLHRDNFIKLVKQHFYDSLMFHRVIDSFMIQGGDPESKNAANGIALGNGSAPGGRIPAEFNRDIIHKKGALAAARDNNPEKASSNCQFYIVQGKVFKDTSLNTVECNRVRPNNPAFSYTYAQRDIYKTIGGTPHLDQNYTVFGEVISGLEVIDKIAKMKRDSRNRPMEDVRMKMRLLN
jgi:cyclophilin family peptidyl-prolyl cis-trans isomerase